MKNKNKTNLTKGYTLVDGKLHSEYKSLPNEAHRAERWAGGRVVRNRKKYTRKGKGNNLPFDSERRQNYVNIAGLV